jgi:hypothetical protein
VSLSARFIACVAIFGWAASAAAQARTVAIFPVVPQGSVKSGQLQALTEAAVRLCGRAGLTSISGEAITSRLKMAPLHAAERCAGDPSCLARYGKALEVDEAVVAFATGSPLRAEYQAVDVKTGKVVRSAIVALEGGTSAEAALAARFAEIFGLRLPEPTEPELAALDDGELDLVPLAPAESQAAGSGAELDTPHRPLLFYSGAGMVGLGVLLSVAALYQELQVRSSLDAASPSSVSQIEAQEHLDEAQNAASRRDVFKYAAAAFVVAGGALGLLEIALFGKPAVLLGPTDGGAQTSLAWRF